MSFAIGGSAGERGAGHPEFHVLLGPDYAGKSTVLTALAGAGWRCVSYDDEFVPADRAVIPELRNTFLTRALRRDGTPYSPDFVLTLLQNSVVYLRDEILRADPGQAQHLIDHDLRGGHVGHVERELRLRLTCCDTPQQKSGSI